jgi:hypothetical protein
VRTAPEAAYSREFHEAFREGGGWRL